MEIINRKIVGMKTRIFRKKTDYFVFAILFVVFGYFALFCGVQELGDSFQYLHQMVSREPVYALMLKLFTGLFGEQYLRPLAILQNILAVISIYWLYLRLTELFHFTHLLSWGVFGALLAPYLLTPLAARSGMIITNSVMTEGISLSLYYVWIGMTLTMLLEHYEKNRKRAVILTALLSFVLAMIRGQFLLCIAVWFFVSAFVSFLQKNYKTIGLLFLGLLILLSGKTYMTKAYHYVESGLYVNTTSGKPMMLANIVYLSDAKDGTDIKNERLKTAYENMVRLVDEQKLSIRYTSGNIIDRAQFHEYGHETINFDIIDPEIEAAVEELNGVTVEEYEHLLVIIDQYAGEIIKDVLPKILPKFLENYLVISTLGFVRSIAIDRSVFPILALVLYFIAVILALFLIKRNRRSAGAWFMLFTLALICGNVFGTSIMIECISRYMIYNLPFFYIAGLTMLMELWENKKGREKNGI